MERPPDNLHFLLLPIFWTVHACPSLWGHHYTGLKAPTRLDSCHLTLVLHHLDLFFLNMGSSIILHDIFGIIMCLRVLCFGYIWIVPKNWSHIHTNQGVRFWVGLKFGFQVPVDPDLQPFNPSFSASWSLQTPYIFPCRFWLVGSILDSHGLATDLCHCIRGWKLETNSSMGVAP